MEVVSKIKTTPIAVGENESLTEEEKTINCAACNHPVTDPAKQIRINASFSHIFANPHGYVFEIGCFSDARGCCSFSNPSDEFSWFPGFFWEIGACCHCLCHLGWVFTSNRKKFYGLILEKLIFP